METTHTQVSLPTFLKLAAHEIRWQLLSILARSGYRVQELVQMIGQSPNLVSYHLRQLRDQHVITERRSTADERAIYYSLDLEAVRSLYQATGEALHPALHVLPQVSSLPWTSFRCPSQSRCYARLWTGSHFPLRRMAGYWVAQVIGVVLAAVCLRHLLGNVASLGTTMPTGSGGAWQSFGLEFLLTFFLRNSFPSDTSTRDQGDAGDHRSRHPPLPQFRCRSH